MAETTPSTTESKQLSTLVPAYQTSIGKDTDRLKQVKSYTEMLECDPQARQAVTFFSNLVLNLIGEYSNENDAIEEFVRKALGSMESTWRSAQRWLLRAPVIGYGVSEKVLAPLVSGGRNLWGYQSLIPITPESIALKGIKMERAMGQPEEIVQWAGTYNKVTIPGSKVVHWAWDDKGDGYGTPIGKGMLPLYEGKKTAEKMWLTGLKRLGEPYFYEVLPDIKVTDEFGHETSLQEVVLEGWKKAAGGSVILRTANSDEVWKGLPRIEVLKANGFDQEFINYVDYVNRAYFLALGIPSLMVMEAQFGTRAQSLVHSDVASIGALPIAEEFAESCLMRDIVRPLIELNYGEQADYGSFPVTQPTDEQFVAGILTSLAGSGVLGLMVDERVYTKIQDILPDYLPEIEPGQFDQAVPDVPLAPVLVS